MNEATSNDELVRPRTYATLIDCQCSWWEYEYEQDEQNQQDCEKSRNDCTLCSTSR